MTALQAKGLKQAQVHAGQAKSILMREPTDPKEIGRDGSSTCRLFIEIDATQEWMRLVTEDAEEHQENR